MWQGTDRESLGDLTRDLTVKFKSLAQVVIECTSTAVKIFYRPWLQKFVSTVQAHSLARVQGMVYIVLSMSKGTGYGYRTGLRVQGMGYIVLSRSKGIGHGLYCVVHV